MSSTIADRRLPLTSRNVRVMCAAVIVAIGLASVLAHALEYRGVERFSKDFALDYSSAKAFVHGEDPYASIATLLGRYVHPPPSVLARNVVGGANWHTPFKVVLTAPLTALPFEAAGIVWLLLSAGCVVAAGLLLGVELGWSRGASVVAGIGFLALPVVQIDLSAGQLNGPMLLLLIMSWRWLRRGRDVACGLALGVLVALKFFPVILGLPLIGTRKIKPVAVAAACALLLTGLGASALGLEHTKSFVHAGRGAEGFDYWDASPANISWWGIATRWLVPNGWVRGADLRHLGFAVAFAGILVLLVAALRPRQGLSREPFIAALPLMLLIWPVVWIHYLVLAIPWVVISGVRVFRRGSVGLAALFGAVAFVMIMGFPPGGAPLDRVSGVQVALLYQLPTYALLGAVVIERVAAARTPDPVPDHRAPDGAGRS
jgi:hypothetical protein